MSEREAALGDRRAPVGGRPADTLPARVTMPLLALVNQQALDDDYVTAARRRGGGSTPGRRHRATVVAVAVFGLLVAVAAVQTSRNATVRDAGRAGLLAQIEAQRDDVASQQQQVAQLREGNTAAAAALTELTQTETAARTRLRRLQAATGFATVRGPGVRAELDQQPGVDAEGQLRDTDLALLVNGLWGAGAEAISVNGQRLTGVSAIRTSGQAVEVNGVGVAPPYTVQAVGDPDTLQSRFYDTGSGLELDNLARDYGFTFEMDNVDELSLPAAPARLERLRSAVPDAAVGPPAVEPEPNPDQEALP